MVIEPISMDIGTLIIGTRGISSWKKASIVQAIDISKYMPMIA